MCRKSALVSASESALLLVLALTRVPNPSLIYGAKPTVSLGCLFSRKILNVPISQKNNGTMIAVSSVAQIAQFATMKLLISNM
jgi:hypothetical protein